MNAKFDEQALRRPEFTEGYRVTLGDGQEWTFPKPTLRFFPRKAADGSIGMGGGFGHDAEYQALRDELIETDDENGYDLMRIQVSIAALLLLKNYDLTNDHLSMLLPLVPGDDANEEMWSNLMPVMMASPPKPLADGSAVA